ncbi:hypothetical protein [Streptomyces sp. NPDC001985]|uniref:hypothetical protein n=1 Tax=Streptomyces sp. NPDC001985 TaxID=3154406 RepID=UPI00332DA2B8
MSGRHAADRPSRPGLATLLLGVIGVVPPFLVLSPQVMDPASPMKPMPVVTADTEPDSEPSATS